MHPFRMALRVDHLHRWQRGRQLIVIGILIVASYGLWRLWFPPTRNIILMIGDGMGPQHIAFAAAYRATNPDETGRSQLRMLELASLGESGMTLIRPQGALVIDSAASASQLATGRVIGSERISVDDHGRPLETLLERAKKLGMATGLVSNTRITHATPAAFAAHQPHRSMENAIAVDILNNAPDLILSGGWRHWTTPDAASPAALALQQSRGQQRNPLSVSKRRDGRDLLEEARRKGYRLAFDRTALEQISDLPLLGLFAASGMADALEVEAFEHEQPTNANSLKTDATEASGQPAIEGSNRQSAEPSLMEMTRRAIELLDSHDHWWQRRGFLLVIEGGQIDWAAHNNDTGTLLHEILQFDRSVEIVLDWARTRSDTLVIVTADHETGAFGVSYRAGNRRIDPTEFFARQTAGSHGFQFGDPEVLKRIHQQKVSHYNLFRSFHSLPASQQTPARLQQLVTASGQFTISLAQAQRILIKIPNPDPAPPGEEGSERMISRIDDFAPFYPYYDGGESVLLGRAISEQQSVVWGSGTHTMAMIPIFSYGPRSATRRFAGTLQNNNEIGQAIFALLDGN